MVCFLNSTKENQYFILSYMLEPSGMMFFLFPFFVPFFFLASVTIGQMIFFLTLYASCKDEIMLHGLYLNRP